MARRSRTAKPRVQLTHPTGRFTVSVSEARAVTLRERGYYSGAKPAGKPAASSTSEGEPSKYAEQTVAELKAELERRYLSSDGKKAELIARLEADDEEE